MASTRLIPVIASSAVGSVGAQATITRDPSTPRWSFLQPRVSLGVLQSANLWGRPVTLFACTFASGCATEARIAEFFRKMARPAGFEPATLGLEGPVSDRLSMDGYHPRRLDGLDLANSRRFLPHFAVSSPHMR